MTTTAHEPPAAGYLLDQLGFVDEIEAATAIDVTPKTLAEYRKQGIGPDFSEVARRILYSKKAIGSWLENGGTRGRDVR
jgi:hypothetical protein